MSLKAPTPNVFLPTTCSFLPKGVLVTLSIPLHFQGCLSKPNKSVPGSHPVSLPINLDLGLSYHLSSCLPLP